MSAGNDYYENVRPSPWASGSQQRGTEQPNLPYEDGAIQSCRWFAETGSGSRAQLWKSVPAMTRRRFVQAISCVRCITGRASQRDEIPEMANCAFKPVIQVKDGIQCILSADSRLAMVFAGMDVHRFQVRGGIAKLRSATRLLGVPFSVYDLTSGGIPVWEAILTAERPPLFTSFFSDSLRVYAQVPDYTSDADDAFVIDVGLKQVTRLPRWRAVPNRLLSFHAVGQSDLVGTEYNIVTRRHESWLSVAIPQWTTKARASYGVGSATNDSFSTASRVFTADRKFVIHADGHEVICRATEDLQPVWAKVVDADFTPSALGISPDGRWIGVGFDGSAFSRPRPSPYIALLNGRDGSQVGQLRLPRVSQFCISPDGRLLASGQRIEHGRSEWELRVQVFDTKTGDVVADLPQARIRGRDQSITAGFTINGLQFTADGKYLAAAGRDTRIWRVGKQAADK